MSVQGRDEAVPEGIRVRAGYRLSVAETSIRHPRFLCFAPDGTLFISVPATMNIASFLVICSLL